MRSKWFELKEEALELRRQGTSMTVIERQLGIPRSTLSGWFRKEPLNDKQRQKLWQNSRDGWAKARINAVKSHNAMKAKRLETARVNASAVMDDLDITPAVLELALAMLYLGEGAKSNLTSLGNSDPLILKFFITALERLYSIDPETLRCDLHLRADQDADELKRYWAAELGLPLGCFRYVAYDKRTAGKPTYESYKGVCVVACGNIAIQRKLVMLYNLFCKKVQSLDPGA